MAIIVNNYVQSAIKLANFRIFLTELQQNFNKKPMRIKMSAPAEKNYIG